jgi:hypothetical protein
MMRAMASATVSRQLLDRSQLRGLTLVVAISAVVAATGGFSAGQVLPVIEYWWMDLPAGLGWPGWSPFFGPYGLTAWIVGGLLPGVAAALVLCGRADRWWVRALAGLHGAGCAVVLGALVWLRPDGEWAPVHMIAFGAGVAAGVYVALGRGGAAAGSRTLAVAVTGAVIIAVGGPTLVETAVEYRPQELRSFRLELVAAYPLREPAAGEMAAVVIDRYGSAGEIIESDGQRFNVHPRDRLVIESADVERVRWIDGPEGPTISVRVDRAAARALGHRSLRRISQLDALFLDGKLIGVPVYEDVVTRLWYSDSDDAAMRGLYQALTGDPP